MLVSEQLHTFPSPNPTLILTCCQSTVVGLGERYVRSFSDTDIDLGMEVVYYLKGNFYLACPLVGWSVARVVIL